MPTHYGSTPPDLLNYGTRPPDLAGGYVAPPVVLSARRPTPAPAVRPNTNSAVANPGALNPAPQAGQGPYGKVPGPIEYPTTPYAEATRIYPGMTSLTPQAMEEIRSQIAGEFTPAEENALWDVSNRFGVQSGMPGAGLWSNRFMGNRVEEGMKRRQQGVQNYESVLNLLSKLGVDPNLAAEIANRNATFNAAPDPEAAAKALEATYRNSMASPAAGTGSPLGRNTYGQNFQFPTGGSSGSGPVNPYNPNPFSPNAPNPYATAPQMPPNPNAVADMSRRSEDEWMADMWDYIDPASSPWNYPDQSGFTDQMSNDLDFITGQSNDPGYDPAFLSDEQWAFPEWDFYDQG